MRKPDEMIRVFCDGLCEPVNPGGTATYGFVLYRGGEKLAEGSGVVSRGQGMTNNVAEYSAAIKVLEFLSADHQGAQLLLLSDSQLVIRQLAGAWAVRSDRIRPLYRQVRRLARRFSIRHRWVPREQNQEADALSVAAYVAAEEEESRRGRVPEVLPQLEPLEKGCYRVRGSYRVDTRLGTCTCPDFRRRHSQCFLIRCKHLLAALELEAGRRGRGRERGLGSDGRCAGGR